MFFLGGANNVFVKESVFNQINSFVIIKKGEIVGTKVVLKGLALMSKSCSFPRLSFEDNKIIILRLNK